MNGKLYGTCVLCWEKHWCASVDDLGFCCDSCTTSEWTEARESKLRRFALTAFGEAIALVVAIQHAKEEAFRCDICGNLPGVENSVEPIDSKMICDVCYADRENRWLALVQFSRGIAVAFEAERLAKEHGWSRYQRVIAPKLSRLVGEAFADALTRQLARATLRPGSEGYVIVKAAAEQAKLAIERHGAELLRDAAGLWAGGE